jgi:hypothetical protein
MADIKTIYVTLWTKDIEDGETNGNVYAGIGGREFYIDSSEDYNDFERGDKRTYILGEMPNSVPSNSTHNIRPEYCDPRKPYLLKTENLGKFPVYIRFDEIKVGQDYWALEYAEINVNPNTDNITYNALAGNDYLWLTNLWGNIVFLSIVNRPT